MKEKFIDWKPNNRTLGMLEKVAGVLERYADMNITLTLRQLYYQLVSQNIIRNSQKEYNKLGRVLSNARLSGIIDWDAIEDRVRVPIRASEWESPASLMRGAVRGYRLPRWDAQPEYVELWCEKDALTSVLEPITDDLHVTLMVNRGYSSSSAMYGARARFDARSDKDCHILYLGDFDPSGEDMVADIGRRMDTFGVSVSVTKIALNPDQIAKYKLPPNPAKMTDSRAAAFVAEHGQNSYEVDALPPDELMKMVRKSIERLMDMDAYEEVKATEEKQKRRIIELTRKV